MTARKQAGENGIHTTKSQVPTSGVEVQEARRANGGTLQKYGATPSPPALRSPQKR
jgi:hypothetical protein